MRKPQGLRRLRTDRFGGIEGMPLQLLIMVIVAGVALAIILGWVVSLPAPAVIKTVSLGHSSVAIANAPIDSVATRSYTFTVTALDAKNEPIPNILVTLEGSITAGRIAKADGDDNTVDGTASFGSIQFRLPAGVASGSVRVTVQKSGFTSPSPLEVLVYRQ